MDIDALKKTLTGSLNMNKVLDGIYLIYPTTPSKVLEILSLIFHKDSIVFVYLINSVEKMQP